MALGGDLLQVRDPLPREISPPPGEVGFVALGGLEVRDSHVPGCELRFQGPPLSFKGSSIQPGPPSLFGLDRQSLTANALLGENAVPPETVTVADAFLGAVGDEGHIGRLFIRSCRRRRASHALVNRILGLPGKIIAWNP